MTLHKTAWGLAKPLVVGLILAAVISCDDLPFGNRSSSETAPPVKKVLGGDHFKRIVQHAGDRLLVFDFYADWCKPCKELTPILEDLARRYEKDAAFFTIDIDQNRELASALGVRGIPYVLFMKNGDTVDSLMGLRPKDSYARIVQRFSRKTTAENHGDKADGEIVNGVRIVRRSTSASLDAIYVYRGEKVKLILEDIPLPYAIHIPEYGISKEATTGTDLEVTFKAKKIGVFPIFCTGNCPTEDGSQSGKIVVMQFKAPDQAEYTELTAEEAMNFIRRANPLILDVRTPGEFYSGHIENARLIPVQQLEARLSEIEDFKNRDIFLYCRSGNRSTVAAEILIRGGFTKLYNLRHGILEWTGRGYKTVQ